MAVLRIALRLIDSLLIAALVILPTRGNAQMPDSVPSPFTMLGVRGGEPPWAPLIRMRKGEAVYLAAPRWRDLYVQLRSQLEAAFGNHQAALRFDEMRREPAASVASLPIGVHAINAERAIASAADTARVIMINEQHHVASDRLLTLQLLPVLRAEGYRYFAAETFDSRDSGLMHRGYALQGVTGVYSDDPVFGEIIRDAIRLGYTLVPYEMEAAQESKIAGVDRQHWRDSIEAHNLVERIFERDPTAKVLVHAGIGHVFEADTPEWHSMALYFRSLTGINPVTVDQTRFGEGSIPAHEGPMLRAAIDAGLVRRSPVILVNLDGQPPAQTDFQVMKPRTTYTRGRPNWMEMNGRRFAQDVPTPECERRTCFVDAHVAAEPDSAVVLDRVDVINAASVRLFLPRAQRARIRIMDASGALLRTVMTTVNSRDCGTRLRDRRPTGGKFAPACP